MCYEIEVTTYNENYCRLNIGNSEFIAYHETVVSVEEGFDDCWSYAKESHYTRPNGEYEVDASTILIGLHVVIFDDGDQVSFIHIPNDRIEKQLKKAIEHAIGLAAIAQKEKELEND